MSGGDDTPEKIVEATSCEYTLTQDDVGCLIRVVYTPVRADGAQGSAVAATSDEPVCAGMPSLFFSSHLTYPLH